MKQVKSIIIVGGGSSGWMSASYLSRVLFDVEITLIESKKTPRIGVGEATVPALTQFMRRLGYMSLSSWVPHCDGSIKTGILFENWYESGHRYWHPFEPLDYLDDKHHVGHYWLAATRNSSAGVDSNDSFDRQFYVSTSVNSEANRAPINECHAYHINADLFGEFLRKASPTVKHIKDDVVHVRLDESGNIDHLVTAEHGIFKADLYVDCTGFRRHLIRAIDPKQHFQSYASSLFCDRALVVRFPYSSEASRASEMRPYVRASARSAGWMWTIPLYSHVSSGYVYSSNFESEEGAERELRKVWGDVRIEQASPAHVKFESGKLDDVWRNNCVAIGLAGSFIEPLESTGLAITQMGLEVLASIIDSRSYNDFSVKRYNMHVQKFCDDVMHFIIAHYCLSNREDTPFWRQVKYETKIPDELAARLEVFRRLLPSRSTKGIEEAWFFRDLSWVAVLLGMKFPFEVPQLSDSLMQKGSEVLTRKTQKIRDLSSTLPSHFDYLKEKVYASV